MAEDRMLSDEILLGIINSKSGGGGGGGTTNYNDLSNQPQIGGVTLTGNKTASDLGLASADDVKVKDVKVDNESCVDSNGNAIVAIQKSTGTYSYEISTYNYSNTKIVTKHDGVVTDTTIISYETAYTKQTIDDRFTLQYVNAEPAWTIELLIDSKDAPAGTKYQWNYAQNPPISDIEFQTGSVAVQLSAAYEELNNSIKSNETAIDGIKDGQSINSFADVENALSDVSDDVDELKSGLINQTARSRSNITSRLTNLVTAVAEQNLEKYGYKIGDYFTGASGYIYYLADMDTFYGGYNNNAIVNTHHISLVVKTGANSKWAETSDTSGGYKTSTLHSFLSSTVLDNIKSDMIALFGGSTGLEHLVSHKLLWTTATSGAWAWSDNAEYISALSEPQVYGTNVWAIDGYQTGEAWKWLEIFHKFNFCKILGNIWWWLRSISTASIACDAHDYGFASYHDASYSGGAVGLIIFH